jgi:PAS domain S-box-containing protein
VKRRHISHESGQTNELANASPRNGRPTVGLLIGGLSGDFQTILWAGVVDAAQERDVNLICFADDRYATTAMRDMYYNLVGIEDLDGLITIGMDTPEFVRDLCEHFSPLPVVSVEYALEGIPSVLVDDYRGMHDLVSHLIEVHGCRHIAFILGPEGRLEAAERYRAYTDALAEHGISLDAELVTQGTYLRDSGADAVRLLLDERQVHCDAVVAANDSMAFGVLEALQARGIQVPQRVAVAGFDDVKESEHTITPLSTVRQPIYERGRKGLLVLLDLLAGAQVDERIVLPTEMVIRQSCGCLDLAVEQAAAGPVRTSPGETLDTVLVAQREEIVSEMMQAMGIPSAESYPDRAAQLLEGCATAVKGESPGIFLRELDEVLTQTRAAGGDVEVWQNALSILRRRLLSHLDGPGLAVADDLWHQGRVMIGQAAKRAQAHQALQAEQWAATLREIGQSLISTFDVQGAMDVLVTDLSRLGVRSCYLSLYEEPQPSCTWLRLMLAYDESGRVELEPEGRRFLSRRLAPEGVLPRRRYSFVVEPLYFRGDELGIVLFEVGPRKGTAYDVLRREISSALQGALILEERKRGEEVLEGERNLLRTLIDNLPDHIYAKDVKGRFTLGNIAVARHMGATTPDELIGKSDFDFYPSDLAAQFYADEQALIQSGESVLDHEEPTRDPTGRPRWTLTTKVLLRDSLGEVIGLVGMGRDITERKRAEETLERRSAQLQTAAEVSRAASSILDLDVLIRQVVNLVRERFDLYYAGLFLVDEAGSVGEPGQWAVLQAGTGEAGEQMIAQGHKLEVGGSSMIGTCVASKEARIALDVGEEAVRFENPLLSQTRSELALPLVSRGEAIGALTIQSAREAAFSDEDIAVLETMADQLANAIANARLFDQAQARGDEMAILSELARTLSTRLTEQEVLDEVHRGASRLLDATNFYIALYDQDTQQVSFPFDTTQEEGDRFPALPADQGITGYIIRNRESVLIEQDVPQRLAEMGVEMVGEPALSWLGVPMIVGDQVLGVMGVQSFTTPGAYDEHDRDLLAALATQVASALTNARLFEQTQAALAEVEATQRRYLERAWSEYAQTQAVSGYKRAGVDLVPLEDTLLPEVRQAMQEQRTVVVEQDDGASVLVVPVTLRGQSLGAVGFKLEGEGRHWSADDIALAEGVSEQFALAAENIRLLDDTQRRAARERLTRDITDKMRRAASIDDIVQTAVDELFGALRTSRTFVRLGVTEPQDNGSDEGS